jgi:hypothetical protein
MTKNIVNRNLPNQGITQVEFTNEQLKPIWKEVNQIRNSFDSHEKFNEKLVGHIKKEYALVECKNYVQSLMFPAIDEFINTFKWKHHVSNRYDIIYDNETQFNVKLNTLWVNFQKKHEYNPPHRHSDVISFVLWLDVPYIIEDEWETFPDLPYEKNNAGCFNFYYTTILGTLTQETIAVDMRWQNKALIFPSELLHSVNPFYSSDEYRISVSGNWSVV